MVPVRVALSGIDLAEARVAGEPHQRVGEDRARRAPRQGLSVLPARSSSPWTIGWCGGVSRRSFGLVGVATAGWLLPALALAGESGPGFRSDLGIVGGVLHFLGAYPFVLLFGTLALGTKLGRLKLGFFTLGSTAGTLLVGIAVSLWAYLGYDIVYAVPALITTVFLNLFMFAVGLKVGPQFFAGLRQDGVKGVAIAVLVVGLNFAIALGGAKMCGLAPGFAPGLISGSMTDTAVIGVATSAIETGMYQPPAGVTAAEVAGNIAAAYAVTYLFSLIGIILLVRYLPRIVGVDTKAAARAAEKSYGGGDGHLPVRAPRVPTRSNG